MRFQPKRAFAALGIAVALCTIGVAQASPGQTVTSLASGTITKEDLVTMLIGDTTPFSNVVVTGSASAIGSFSGFADLGADSGVVLSTGYVNADGGNVTAVPGPNTAGSTTGELFLAGDSDLDSILAAGAGTGTPLTTSDAIALEFDFVPATSTVVFTYIFGSEEYLQYVGSQYNDIFALFVNGTNCAVVGSSNQAVSINTINPGANSTYYRNNPVGSGNIDTGFNGVTIAMECRATVTPGVNNHIKFVIADTNDYKYDSGVFIIAGSFITDIPVAHDDAATVMTNQSVVIDVLANDEGDGLTLSAPPDAPGHGTAVIQSGKIVYTPAPGYSGPDSFTYTITNSSGVSDTATVTIEVNPVAVDDAIVINMNTSVTIDVLVNDLGTDLVLVDVTAPAHGTVVIENGKVVYTPDAGYFGTDSFSYMITGPYTVVGNVNITILAPPIAVETGGAMMSIPIAGALGLIIAGLAAIGGLALRRTAA